MNIKISDRLKKLPPYLFVEIDKTKRKLLACGRDLIDFGVGDPDLPTPNHIIEALKTAADDPKNHRYALDGGMPVLRRAIAGWYEKRFSVKLNPDTEILPLIGSKEGIAHMPLAFINAGDSVLVPDPCYPPYKSGSIFAGGKIVIMPLLEKNGFLPDLNKIKPQTAKKSKLMFINYPNNPTAAVADEGFFKEVVKFANKFGIIVCHDAAYSEISFDGYSPPSFLKTKGAKEVGIEFHSLSKTYNMTGWRIGFACGNSQIISALAKVKSNIDSGIFQAIQIAGIAALEGEQGCIDRMRQIYQERRDILIAGLNSCGFSVKKPKATFYIWMSCPKKFVSTALAKILLEKADIVVTPGIGFGQNGEGYIRLALTVDKERIKEAIDRIKKTKI